MRKIIGFLLASLASIVAVSGCSPSGPLYGNQGNTTVAAVRIASSQLQIAPDDSTTATISATVLNSNSNAVQDATVVFASSAGALTIAAQGKSDSSGVATATLRAAGAAPGTVISVTATVNNISSSIQVTVLATTQTMTLTTSATQIASDNTTTATITAFVRGASNQFLPNIPVNFSASSGGISVASAVTDQNGAATTVLSAATDPTNRTIIVTATTGPVTQAINVDVGGTAVSVTGPASMVQGNQGSYVATLVTFSGLPLPGRSVTLVSSRGNLISAPATRTTDANGRVTFTVTGSVAGADTLTATALGVSGNHQINVSQDSLTITAPTAGTAITLGQVANVSATWITGGAPAAAGQVINFSATRGTLSSATAATNASGVAAVTIVSNGAGPAVITATTPTGVSTQVVITFISITPARMTLQASPTNVQILTPSTITAIVRDATDNLVQGQTVDFSLNDVTGGSLSVGSTVTDAQGIAQTIYTASSATSAANGVIINAVVRGTAVAAQASLTVGGRSIFMSLGTGNTIIEPNTTQYQVDYSVQALDAAGNPLVGIPLSFTLHSLRYYKGYREVCPGGAQCAWRTIWTIVGPPSSCPNEDLDLNGQLDAGEDLNGSLRLEPGDIASVFPGTATTNATGTATVRITYPQNYAYYLDARLTATATVQGTETSTHADFPLQGATTDFDRALINPPGMVSPYGFSTTCLDTL